MGVMEVEYNQQDEQLKQDMVQHVLSFVRTRVNLSNDIRIFY